MAAGDPLTPIDQPQGIIARHSRSATSLTGVTTTETGFIRMDGIAIRNGYTYEVIVARTVITVSATTVLGAARLRGSTSGNATIASALLDGGEYRPGVAVDTSNVPEGPFMAYFYSTTNGTLSVLLSVIRVTAAGSVGMYSGVPIPMIVKEIGGTPTDAGTDL